MRYCPRMGQLKRTCCGVNLPAERLLPDRQKGGERSTARLPESAEAAVKGRASRNGDFLQLCRALAAHAAARHMRADGTHVAPVGHIVAFTVLHGIHVRCGEFSWTVLV